MNTTEVRGAAALKVAEVSALFKFLVEQAPIGFAFFDTDLKYRYVNAKLAQIKGIPAEDHIGKTVTEAFPTLYAKADQVLRTVLKTGQPVLDVLFEGQSPARPGVQFCLKESWYPIRQDTAEIVGVGAIIEDMTQQKRAERERQQYLEELEAANEELAVQGEELVAQTEELATQTEELTRQTEELTAAREAAESASAAKNEFLAVVSHELRTPLQNIMGYAHLLATGKLNGPVAEKQALEVIQRNAKAQLHLVEDILDIGRITTGNLKLDRQPIDLIQVVGDALQGLLPGAQERGVKITVTDAVGGPCVISGDARRIQQVVWNLVSNALKFTPPDGNIDIRLEARARSARIIVTDSGEGIEADFLPHVFDMFSQHKRGQHGTGIGLAVVEHVVKLHGGTVTASSEGPGRGSTFTVTLPVIP